MALRPSLLRVLCALVLLGVPPATAARSSVSVEAAWAQPLPSGNALYGLDFANSSRGVAVGVHGTVVRTEDGGTSWSASPGTLAVLPDLFDVVAVDPQTWIAVGGGAGVYRSTDGGLSWVAPPHPGSGVLRDVARSGTDLVAVGEHGLVLRSTDGGATWAAGPAPLDVRLTAQTWLDANRGFVVAGEFGEFTTPAFATSDGGQTWSPLAGVPPDGLRAVAFLDSSTGFVFGEAFAFRSDDGGATWSDLGSAFPNYAFALLPLGPSSFLTGQFGEGAEIARTTNGGQNFEVVYDQSSLGGVLALAAVPGGRLAAALMSGMILTSDDGGQSWTPRLDDATGGEGPAIAQVAVLPDGRVLAVTDRSGPTEESWLLSDDGGRSFSKGANPPPVWTCHDLVFRDATHGFLAGFGVGTLHHVFRTQDGGATWTAHPLPAGGASLLIPRRLAVPSASRVFATAVDGALQPAHHVFRSTDSGLTYQAAMSGLPPEPWEALAFVDDLVGFVASKGPTTRLFATTDGGQSWFALPAVGLGSSVRELRFQDAQHGLAACLEGVYRTSDGGQTFTLVSAGTAWDLDLRADGRGVAIGHTEESVRRTEDGGVTWHPVDVPIRDWNPSAALGFLLSTVGLGEHGFVVGGAFGNLVHVGVTAAEVCQPDLGSGGPGSVTLSVCGEPLSSGNHASLRVEGAPPLAAIFLAASTTVAPAPVFGGTLLPGPAPLFLALQADASGALTLDGIPGGNGPLSVNVQALVADGSLAFGAALTNAVRIEFLP